MIIIFIALIGLAGCENPGSIGSEIGDSRADVVIDTLTIGEVTPRTLNFYSGGFSFFSAGEYEDPLLGNISATGLLKPTLPLAAEDSLTSDARMYMRFIFDDSQVYGDSLANQTFDVYEIDELWRSTSFKIQNDIQLDQENGPITSFTVGDEDSIDVELPSDWVEQYRSYSEMSNADSLYEREVFGLALVPTNSNKIIAPNTGDTEFVVHNPEEDTFSVSLDRWAYTLQRGNSGNLPTGSVAWHSTNEQILSFGLDLSSIDLQGPDISRAELVFYQNDELMQQSLQSEPSSVSRAEEPRAQLHLVDPDQLPDNIAPGNPIANGIYSDDDGAYHFEFTSQLQNVVTNGVPEGLEFVVTLVNDGIVKTSVIHTDEAPEGKRPKLIITSLKDNSN